ncbi:hypothetical protein [Nocardioides sp. NPDC006303]|uniref:hypothetical protein n=1 Tax=Nocardioides sp. NPDC006303 TaxID=3156747 RepID=UPI0033A57086
MRLLRAVAVRGVLVEVGIGIAILCTLLLLAGLVIRASVDESRQAERAVVTDQKALEVWRDKLEPHLEQINSIPTPEGLRWPEDAVVDECRVDESDHHLVQVGAWFVWEATEEVAFDEVSEVGAAGYVEILDYLADHGWRISKRENLNGMVSSANRDFDSADLEHPSGVTMRTQLLGNSILGHLFFKGAPKVCSFSG